MGNSEEIYIRVRFNRRFEIHRAEEREASRRWSVKVTEITRHRLKEAVKHFDENFFFNLCKFTASHCLLHESSV